MAKSSKKKYFVVDARTILTLGRDSIKDSTTALVELVKNSYDADAETVEIEIITKVDEPFIRIADNGHGMTETIIDEHWLRIGFSSKKVQRISGKERRRTGEKGIGRISADRLGAVLVVCSKAANSPAIGLQVNWDKFDVKDAVLENIEIDILDTAAIKLPSLVSREPATSGTELIVKSLRQGWTLEDINTLKAELATLVSPFSTIDGFRISLKTDVGVVPDGQAELSIIEPHLDPNYVIRLDLEYPVGEQQVRYIYSDRSGKSSTPITMPLNQFIQKLSPKEVADFEFGPVTVTLAFYLLKTDLLKNTGRRLSDLRTYLRNYSGIGIYRDSIRVKPYGSQNAPEWDWLNLGRRVAQSPAGPSSKGFRIGPNQIVGAVFVSRDTNPKLVDSSSREGMVQGPAFLAMKRLVLASVSLLESRYREVFAQNQPALDEKAPSQQVRSLGQELRQLRQELTVISQVVSPDHSKRVAQALGTVESVLDRIDSTERSIDELATQATIYRGLATLGIAASVFGHETQSALGGLSGSTANAIKFLELTPPKVDRALAAMQQSDRFAERIASWGTFALERVRRDKRQRRRITIGSLVTEVISQMKPAMEASSIQVQIGEIHDVQVRTFAMDIEAAVVNLLTNAYSACKEVSDQRIIRTSVHLCTEDDTPGYEIVIADSGPGVADTFRERIWSPLFTTKAGGTTEDSRQQSGTGLGLAIVDSVVNELDGKRSVDTDPELQGARFRIWFPLKG